MAEVVTILNEHAAKTEREFTAYRNALEDLRADFLKVKKGLDAVAALMVKTDLRDMNDEEREGFVRRRMEYASVGGNIARAARKYGMATGDWRDLCEWTQAENSPASRKLEVRLRRYSVDTVKRLWDEYVKDQQLH